MGAESLALQTNPFELEAMEVQDTDIVLQQFAEAVTAESNQVSILETERDTAIETVADSYEPTRLESIADSVKNRVNKLRRIAPRIGAVLLSSVSVGVFAEAASADTTTTVVPTIGNITTTQNSFVEVNGLQYSQDDVESGAVRFGVADMAKGVSKKVIKKAEANGQCEDVGQGTSIPEWTNSYTDANGHLVKFEDSDWAKLCNVNGHLRKVSGSGPNGGDCGNLAWAKVLPKIFTGKVVFLQAWGKVKAALHASASATGQLGCKTPDGSSEASLTVNGNASSDVEASLRTTAKTKGSALVRMSGSIVESAKAKLTINANTECASVTPTPNTPPVTPVTPTIPGTPGIVDQKTLIGSYNPDGSLYSLITTKHGDTDKWSITVQNTGNEDLNVQNMDTPPTGEVVIPAADGPFGLQIDGNGIGTWGNVILAGQSATIEIDTRNVNMPCNENELNLVQSVGTDSNGNQVMSQATAGIKEQNSGPDCNYSTGGAGQ